MTTLVSAGDGVVHLERLEKLLSYDCEYDDLDFKREWDIKGYHFITAMKTFAAMSSNPRGGYIIVGVSDYPHKIVGIPEEMISDKQFDSTTLSNQYKSFTGNGSISSAIHEIDGKKIALIYVPASPDYFSIMRQDGIKVSGHKKDFSTGDVFVRENSSTVRWQKEHLSGIVERIRVDARSEVIGEFARHFISSSRMDNVFSDPNQFSQIDPSEQFSLLQNIDDSKIISRAGRSLTKLMLSSDPDSLESKLYRRSLASVMSHLLIKDEQEFQRLLKTVTGAYTDHFNMNSLSKTEAMKAYNIAILLESLGALAVREMKYTSVRKLADTSVNLSDGYVYTSILRHAAVSAARAGLFRQPGQQKERTSPLTEDAIHEILSVPALRPDFPSEIDYELGKDEILNSILSFDFDWCLIALDSGDESDTYPGFAFYSLDRIADHLSDLLNHEERYKELLTDCTVEQFKDKSKDLIELGRRVRISSPGGGWMSSLSSAKVDKILR